MCGGTPSNPVWGPSGGITFPPVFILAKRTFSSLFYFKQDISLVLLNVCSVAKSSPSLCNLMACSTPGFPVLHYLPEFAQLMSIESGMPANHLVLYRPLLLLPLIFPGVKVFSSESGLQVM